jgi:hypothetical protein
VTRVEIQSGADATPSESLSEVFQVCAGSEARGWCVAPGASSAVDALEAALERRRG